MKKIIFILFTCISNLISFSQNQYALLIGINHYSPPQNYKPSTNIGRLDFQDLHGCRNDVLAMYSVIVSRFNFNAKHIDTLMDDFATRDGILHGMNDLLQKCNSGDIAFIYYAGHGSQVKNSLSATKADKLDETIVPSDTWKEGVRDIRDKELAAIFNKFIDKKIKLTVIFDCCHSGSISRGPNLKPGKFRFMPEADWDAKDPSAPLAPDDRPGNYFLIYSAAQANEYAAEMDEYVNSLTKISHGAFTLALTQALQQESANTSALALFTSARSILKNNGATQEPVMGGQLERKKENLFGVNKNKLFNSSIIAVNHVENNSVILDGGWALGIYKGNELSKINENNNQDTLYKLRIDDVTGVNTSVASVIKGDINKINPGFLFNVTNWVSPDVPLIKIYIPSAHFSDGDVQKFCSIAAEIKKSHKIVWLENLKSANPYTTIFFDNDKCLIKTDTAAAKEIKNITALNILSLCKKDSTVYFEIPISEDSGRAFINKLNFNHNIKLVDDISSANYCVFGKLGQHNLPAYGLRKVQTSAADSLESMPLVTDCFEMNKNLTRNVADSISELVMKLSKIRGWLNVIKTPDASKKTFPFHIEIFNEDKKFIVTDHYKIGDSISFRIVADSDFYDYQASLKDKYVYIFGLDQSGSMSLYFPDNRGNAINKFPKYDHENLVNKFPINLTYRIPAPTGTDNFLMLATDEAITNPDLIFNQQGVNTNAVSRGFKKEDYKKNPFYQLLDLGNSDNDENPSMRGKPKSPAQLPATWVLQKFSFKCTY